MRYCSSQSNYGISYQYMKVLMNVSHSASKFPAYWVYALLETCV